MKIHGVYTTTWDDSSMSTECLIDMHTGSVECLLDHDDSHIDGIDQLYVVVDEVKFEVTQHAEKGRVVADLPSMVTSIKTLLSMPE